jgi:hypothetical protein
LGLDVAWALALKAAALAAIYFLFYDHAKKPVVTPAKMAAYLTGAAAPTKQ